ncbi:MAG: peptidoglycan editing factor PgeF [Pseudomonadota bacterium]
MTIEVLRPDWPAPAHVHAASTMRTGGVSEGAYRGLNLRLNIGDAAANVRRNQALLRTALALPNDPVWLQQVHGVAVVELPAKEAAPVADASFSTAAEQVCAVQTADCLPVLFCDRAGRWVAAAHAGWRGLCAGVLEATIKTFAGAPGEILAWLGPAIGPTAFEVGPEVRDAFCRHEARALEAFRPGEGDRLFADLYLLARQRLQAAGVRDIYGGGLCTYSDPVRFFSYRRDRDTGRQASLIWRSAP